ARRVRDQPLHEIHKTPGHNHNLRSLPNPGRFTYDSADRITDAGYTYDDLGRTLTVPGHGSIDYYANDLVRRQTNGTTRQTWTLDAAFRHQSWTVETSDGTTWTTTAGKTNHYADDSDTPRWISESATVGDITRYIPGPDGTLAATSSTSGPAILTLTALHGDIALYLPLDTNQAPTTSDTDEFGNPRTETAPRYNWLGAHQRSSETLTGLTLMGVRLYNPNTGRFLSTDPIRGGSCNAYDYTCGDPINLVDLDGRMAAIALVGLAVTGISAGTVLSIIGVAAVVAIIGLIWWYGKAWAINKVRILWAKAPKKSGKETARDIPSWARGKGKEGTETTKKAVDRTFKEHYRRLPTAKERRSGEWKQIEKHLNRK
ncbi:RHS repeat-associated core domain-containing protein, partial [Streptomyces sp. NPDC051286]|uniref:RHS repeat-associated core domain-containing protein n=1 Tax=Streptomyces sp. NPDC051286 TaxID=3365647 RepID=UPI0037A3D388